MQNIIMKVLALLALLLAGCGGGSSSNEPKANSYKDTVELSSSRKSSVTIDGAQGDSLTLEIPSLNSNMKDVNVTVTLSYENDFPEIIIDKDINFSAPVRLVFNSNLFSDTNISLVYNASDGNSYFIPSTIQDGSLTATLQHFSRYSVEHLPEPSDTLAADIRSRLAALKTKAHSARLNELDQNGLNDLFVKISVYRHVDEFQSMLNDFATVLVTASSNTLKHYKNTSLQFFTNQCPTDALENALHELFQVHTFNDKLISTFGTSLDEADYMLADSMRIDSKIAFENVLKDSKNAWELQFAPKCDPKLFDFIICTKKYINITETAILYFPDMDASWIGAEIETKLEQTLDQDAHAALNDGDCECMLFYKDILNTYFRQALSSTIQQLDSATKQCGTRCPLLWDITEDVNGWYDWNPDFATSGHAEFKNVYIEQRDDAWVELSPAQREACAPYKANRSASIPASLWTGNYFDDGDGTPPEFDPSSLYLYTPGFEITQEDLNTFTIEDSSSMPTPQILFQVDNYTEVDLYPLLNKFQPFTVSATQHGTISYTFTPHSPGFKYPNQ
jgi:hypothetical protein